jgi:multidrug efflux pump subunit AcrA (membrane-fusion protein)
VLVHVDAFPEKVMTASLVAITPLTEVSFTEWPPVRSFRAYAQIESPDSRLRPGMNSGADIVEMKIPDAISIPAKALFTHDGQPVVYIKSGDRYVMRKVQVRAKNPDEIALDGLAAGTSVTLTEPPLEKR